MAQLPEETERRQLPDLSRVQLRKPRCIDDLLQRERKPAAKFQKLKMRAHALPVDRIGAAEGEFQAANLGLGMQFHAPQLWAMIQREISQRPQPRQLQIA